MIAPRDRAFELVRRHGRTTVSFQALESDFRYWFDGDDAVIAFVDTGGAWVAAGGPIAADQNKLGELALRFIDAARAQDRRACFFAAEQPLVEAGLPALQIGEQPVWRAGGWPEILAARASLRYQVKRARAKGVVVRRLDVGVREIDRAMRDRLESLAQAWQASHDMAPMQFLVKLEPLAFAAERTVYVAERGDALVGLASCVPVYARTRLFVEDLVRAPDAPNGTTELLIDAVMRDATCDVTLGLAPLAGELSPWLRFARKLGAPFYDFEGLRAFKAKLGPQVWEPVYLCVAPGTSKLVAMRDSLRAFAGGSLIGFASRTLFG